MIEHLLKNKNFQVFVALATTVALGLTIYEKIYTIKKTKLELIKLTENEN